MKKLKNLFFLFIFVLISPLFAFACGETTFDDVPYVSSPKTAPEVISDIDYTRDSMINSIELKVLLTTTNTYTFLDTDNQNYKVVKDVIKTTIGKVSDKPSAVAMIEKTRFDENGQQLSFESKIYENFSPDSGNRKSYVYTKSQVFDSQENTVLSTDYTRESYSQASIRFLDIYNSAVPVINPSMVKDVKHKQFEDVNYYKLSSDIDELYYVNDYFAQVPDLYENPTLFGLIDESQDYVMPFTCEFGLKSSDGHNYITYSTINYEIENQDRQIYLKVSSRTDLKEYGDKVNSSWPEDEDKGKYTSHTFLKDVNKDKFFITYKVENGLDTVNTSIAKFNETLDGGKTVTSYSAVVTTFKSGGGEEKKYYYMQGREDGTYKTYELNLSNKTYVEISINTLEFLSFEFDNIAFSKKDGNMYKFASPAALANPNEYTGIELDENGEVLKIVSKTAGESVETELEVIEYGNEISTLELIQSLEGFTLTTPLV